MFQCYLLLIFGRVQVLGKVLSDFHWKFQQCFSLKQDFLEGFDEVSEPRFLTPLGIVHCCAPYKFSLNLFPCCFSMLLNLVVNLKLFLLVFLIESCMMLPRHGRPKAQLRQAKSSAKVGYETNLLECLTQTLVRGDFSSPLIV